MKTVHFYSFFTFRNCSILHVMYNILVTLNDVMIVLQVSEIDIEMMIELE